MRRTYKIENLCCANCADKIQREIGKLPGVESATVNFLTQRFSLNAQDDQYEAALAQSLKIFNKIEPDCHVLA